MILCLCIFSAMVRNYIHKRERTYDEKTLEQAVDLVRKGNPIHKVSKDKMIPKETLRRWVTSPPSKIGSGTIKRVLTEAEEEHVLKVLEEMGRCGWPNGTKELKYMIKTYLDSQKRSTVFKFNFPGKDWMIGFRKRWADKINLNYPELKNEQKIPTTSATQAVDFFFKIFCNFLAEDNLQNDTNASARLFTISEIACSIDPMWQLMLFKKTSKDVYFPTENIGNNLYTILVCGSAQGEFIEPLVIYKGKHLKESWMHGGPSQTQYTVTDNGWMTELAFENWFKETFIPFVKDRKKPLILLYDGYIQRLSYSTIMIANAEKIIILCLPPHTGHALQPLYVGIFQQLNEVWRQIVLRFFQREQVNTVTKSEFPTLLKDLWGHVFSDNLIGGFKKTGLWPVDLSAVKTEKYFDALKTSVDSGKLLKQTMVSATPALSSVKTESTMLNSKRKHSSVVGTEKNKLKSKNKIRTKKAIKKTTHHTSSNTKWKSKVKIKKKKEKIQIDDGFKDDNCLNCGQIWSTYEGADSELWLICDICDRYVCPKCIPPDTNLSEDFYCMDCVK